MFKLGESYKIKLSEDGVIEYYNMQAIEIEMPMVKFHNGTDEIIVNTASSGFISATPQNA